MIIILLINASRELSLVSGKDSLRSHRSADRGDLIIPRTFTMTVGSRGFAVSGPTTWNSLPTDLQNKALSLTNFESKLKTHVLFMKNSLFLVHHMSSI